jgi:hypothetical protein
MATINIEMTLQEAKYVCMFLSKADPLGVCTGGLLSRIDENAKKYIEAIENDSQVDKKFAKIGQTKEGV